jgi:hypothetical protein
VSAGITRGFGFGAESFRADLDASEVDPDEDVVSDWLADFAQPVKTRESDKADNETRATTRFMKFLRKIWAGLLSPVSQSSGSIFHLVAKIAFGKREFAW